ncbi:uncharacterized protein I303_107569 [Kwoniella dejecticola CBS 10117]|uniref:Uncharacterized protein n=1 Tax=Kwoniella dejecticola CBS 10117 TaxID=1296121 RepID=A0A1A5ZV34_9TREE|nr:uncharacterized protein I303_07579 [Kwoniella dejecticola CBS 10117]OBR81669.1 hypothetical protein I303_07579 [Kwoniella dejecticola CBS 10117]
MKSFFATSYLAALTALVRADNYANFFTDSDCSVDGSIGFNLNNPGCFSQLNMGSVYIPNNGIPWNSPYCLVMTYDSQECTCQNDGYEFNADGFCHPLDGKAKSYRFISGGCDQNNC